MKNFGSKKLMVFIILAASVALAYQLPYLRYTFYDQMMAAYNIGDVEIGLIATAVSLTNTICYPIGGWFASRFSMRSLLLVTLVSFVILSVAFAFTTDYFMLLGIHILFGFFGIATLWSAYLTGVRNLGDEASQSTLFGTNEATRGVIQTLCGFAFLAVFNIAATPLLGFRNVMLLGAAISGLFLVLAFIFLPKTPKEDTTVSDDEEKFSVMDVLKNKGVWITILIVMCAYASWTLGNGYLTTYTVRGLGVDETLASSIGMVRTYVIVFVAGFIGGWVMDKFTFKGNAFLLLFGLTIALLAGIMLTDKVIPVCIGLTLVLAFIVNIMKCTYWSTMGQAGIPVKMTAMATGIISLIAFIPDFVLPPICGSLIESADAAGNIIEGFNAIFLICAAFSAVGLVAAYILKKQTKSLNAATASEVALEGEEL